MFLGVASPLVEVFLKDGVPRDVRTLAARGLATTDALDRLALLALLTSDPDPDVAALASATIDALPAHAVDDFFTRADPPAPLRAWFLARRGPAPAPPPTPGYEAPPPVPDAAASEGIHLSASSEADAGVEADDAILEGEFPDDEEEVHQLLTSLPVPEKIKLATLGRREQRAILVRDPNRIVASAVLASPKLTDTEVENFARMQNVSDEVLRIIGTSRNWTKNYTVVAALVKNPRTPTAVSLPLLMRLVERDIKGLSVDRNVPESVRIAARKQLAVMQSRKE
ncbi:hypothetical protein TBR22_A31120 [Luteitalea sp. TBR-22]|uniref:hypothetical protein n=1 Tax=Luteitalea sp. TBR-22 TaxID=2802971 RepID=UPI001AF0F302|nr:hypothetical protein [Luteitalea sp. TBR-22]BCS33884.1 hypothetical protein TBR22_A31120 [Luteitalea sp. TBR-22]